MPGQRAVRRQPAHLCFEPWPQGSQLRGDQLLADPLPFVRRRALMSRSIANNSPILTMASAATGEGFWPECR
jgi:hypothetical protein